MTIPRTATTRRQFLIRSLVSGGALLAAPSLLTACANAGGPTGKVTGPPRRGGKATFARNSDSLSVDPVVVGDNESIWVVSGLFERLYQSAPNGGGSVPCLATSYQVSADKLSWTFPLRPGVRFSDGTPLTSADVKFSIDRCTASDDNGYMNVAIAAVTTPDPQTVVIHTHYPTELLGVVSFYGNGVLPKNLGGKSAKAFFDQPVGTGPFRMASWNLGQQMTLRRNDYYWRPGKPYLDEVDLTVVASDNTRMLQLRGSQADIVEAPPWAQLSSLKDEGGLSIQLFPSTIVDFLSLNERYKPLNDPLVRTAMSQAIDRQAIVKVALFGYGQAAGSVFAPSWPAYDASLTAPVRDLAAARATLARSSFPKGFSVTHSIDGGDTVQSTVAQLIQNNLADIGIKVKIQQYDSNTLETLVGDHEFELYHDLLSLDVMDPVENVPSLVDPSTGGDGEWAGFHDKQVLAWCNEAQHTTDAAVQTAAYQNIQRRIRELNQFIPLYYVPYAYATSTRLQGLVVPPTGDYRLEEAWLAT